MLLSRFLQFLEDVVYVFLRLVETHGVGRVLHAKIDIGLVKIVEVDLAPLQLL